MPTSPGSSAPALARAGSRWQIVFLSLNDVIGSGVYLIPAASVAYLGVASVGAVLLAGLFILLIVLCFAEASTHFDQPGSAYLYTKVAFGDLVGFQVGWMTWLTRVASIASLSAGFAQAMSFVWPAAAGGWGYATVVVVPLTVLTAINVVGVAVGLRTMVGLVIVKGLPLVLFVVAGVFAFRTSAALEQVATEPDSVGQAALLLLFAYAGFENTAAAAGEYRDPKRDVPFALLTQIAVVALLYLAVQIVCMGTLPDLGRSETPLAEAAEGFLGSWAGFVLTLGAAVSILGTVGNTVLSGPRYLYALSQDGYGPRFLARVHPRFRTPATAIVLQSLVSLPFALTGSFVGLAALSALTRLLTYVGTAVSVPVLRRRMPSNPGAFRIPGGVAIPAAATIVSVALAANAGADNLIAMGAAFVVGLVLFKSRRQPT